MMNYKKLYCLLLAFFFVQNLSCSQSIRSSQNLESIIKNIDKNNHDNHLIINYLASLPQDCIVRYHQILNLQTLPSSPASQSMSLNKLSLICHEALQTFQENNSKKEVIIQGICKFDGDHHWHVIETYNLSNNLSNTRKYIDVIKELGTDMETP